MMRAALLVALLALPLANHHAAAQTRVGDFTHVTRTDAMTDRDLSYIGTSPVGGSEGSQEAELAWRCSGSTIEMVLRSDVFEDLSGPTPIRWRFDRDPPSERELWRATTLEGSVHAPERTIYPFTENASMASTVLFRVADGEGRSHDYRFSLRGLNNGLNRLACSRNLEVLGERHAAALLERAASTYRSEPLEPEAIARLTGVYPFVGHRALRRYMSSAQTCWRTGWGAVDVIFFRSEQEATAEGFVREDACF